jgi:NarL family two-component system response regulator LiaR
MTERADRIRVLIVDDHQVVRQGLSTFLGLRPEILVVGEAADGKAAVEMAARLEPDIVLMDLVMPELDGIEATRQIRAHHPQTRVIALTSFTEDDKVIPAIRAGAASYLLKDVTPDALVEAILAVHRGEARLHPDIARKLMERVAQAPGGAHAPPLPAEGLTTRELEVVRLVARGRSNHEIARELVISEKTVKTHVSNILSKLNLEDRTQIAIHAIKSGLVEEN